MDEKLFLNDRQVLLTLIQRTMYDNPLLFLGNHYSPKSKQKIAHHSEAKYVLFGGAMGGGKSFYLCAEAIINAMRYANNRLVIVRKELTTLKRTTMITFFKICPPHYIKKFNKQELTVEFINGSLLMFLEANISRDMLFDKLKSLEIGWFGIDEANEVDKSGYSILKTRLRWTLPNEAPHWHHLNEDGKKCPNYRGRLTSNPEQCWLIGQFVESKTPEEVYIESLTTDNYSEDSEYVATLIEAFKDNPEALNKYMKADWSMKDAFNQLISSIKIHSSFAKIKTSDLVGIGVDVARMGDDKTVITVIKNGNIHIIHKYNKLDNVEVADKVQEAMTKYQIPANRVAIDGVGNGSGVIDTLKSRGYGVYEVIGGAKPVESADISKIQVLKPKNIRTQVYLLARYAIESGLIGGLSDEELIDDLINVRYQFVSDKQVQVIGKDLIKKILGRSPDCGDSFAYASFIALYSKNNTMMLPFFAPK